MAGGPSLLKFDFSSLAGLNMIAINRAHEVASAATVLWWSDARYWRKHRGSLLAHPAPYKATCQLEYAPGEVPEVIHTYKFTGLVGFDDRPGCLRHGNNSSYAAIHLAAHLGAKLIVLFGVDMRHSDGGRTHFHSGHTVWNEERTLTELMLPHFKTIAHPLAQSGISVLNASPDSALKVWPRCSIDSGLASLREFSERGEDERILGACAGARA